MSLRIFFLKRIIFRFTLAFKKVLGDGEYQGLSKTKATKPQSHKATKPQSMRSTNVAPHAIFLSHSMVFLLIYISPC